MLIKILLIVAIVIQTIATLFAIRLIRSIWILFTIGFTLLSVERVVQFLRANGQTLPYEVFVWLGLVISISMSIGVMYAHKLFKYIARLNRQRQLLNKRILTAVLRTEEKSRSRFAKDLHDGLGPLLSSARMSLSALQRESLPADQQENRRGDPLAAGDFEQPFAACAQRFRPGAGHPELRGKEFGDARREDPLHDQPSLGAL
mgnify:CR=1 FL=1